MPKRVLVTGGAGFIGSHMADGLINHGYEVIVLDNESTGFRENVPEGAIYIRGDVRNQQDVEKAMAYQPDTVFHIAGQASTILSFNDPEADLLTNTVGTLNILNACMTHHVPRILFASSMTVYGHPQALPVPETASIQPVSYYGITKYAAERYLITSGLRHDLDFDFSVTAFRMFNVYGARQRLDNPYQGVMGIFIGNILRNDPITIHGDGEQSRDFVHIEDVVQAWLYALENPDSKGLVFNLGVGEAISINRLVDVILAANKRSRQTYPILFGPNRPGDQRHMVANISLARDILGWKPQIDLPTGLRKTLAWAEREVKNNISGIEE